MEVPTQTIKRKGIIYKISSPQEQKMYIGSTKNSLALRKALHRNHYKRYLNGCNGYCTSFELLKHPDVQYEVLETMEYDEIKELRKREKEVQDTLRELDMLINMNASYLSEEERKERNRVRAKANYHASIVEGRAARLKAYYNNREERNARSKAYYHLNKDKLNQKRKESMKNRVECECGILYGCTTEKHLAGLPHKKRMEAKSSNVQD